MQYICILGTSPELSILEIESACIRLGYAYEEVLAHSNVLICDIQTDNSKELQMQLGGTIKIAEVITWTDDPGP